jgi:hypothetical protein
MSDKKPKDYLMGEAAYNAFYKQQPQVWFDELSHDYQMRWVNTARAVVLLHDSFKHKPGKFKGSEKQRAQWRAQKKRSLEKVATKKTD